MDYSEGSGATSALISLAVAIAAMIAVWKVYVKAGQHGWVIFIPIFNIYVLLKIAGKPGWWILLYFVPIVNIFINFIVSVAVAKAFNRSSLFGIFLLGVFPIIGYMILGFGSSVYKGNAKARDTTPIIPDSTTPQPPLITPEDQTKKD